MTSIQRALTGEIHSLPHYYCRHHKLPALQTTGEQYDKIMNISDYLQLLYFKMMIIECVSIYRIINSTVYGLNYSNPSLDDS